LLRRRANAFDRGKFFTANSILRVCRHSSVQN
jgi:hypothetical protein